jgi:hypothetical protein
MKTVECVMDEMRALVAKLSPEVIFCCAALCGCESIARCSDVSFFSS